MSDITRRDFIKVASQSLVALSSLVGLGILIRFLSYQPAPPPPKKYEVGTEKNYPLDSRTLLPDIPALLIHSASGYSAISLVCTHLGCTVQDQAGILTCPCHGSRYDIDGKVTHRPANSALQSLRVELDANGNLTVYKNA